MRFMGLALGLLLLDVGSAAAQLNGTVESIGFEGYIRPDCWTPMVVSITPDTSKTDFYQLRVRLEDMDRDQALYTRTISVTGALEGRNSQQKFRMYFIPPPVDDGLPDMNESGSLRGTQDRLRVSVATMAGKWICDLPITSGVHNLDPKPSQYIQQRPRGDKLILAVAGTSDRPIYHDSATDLFGVMEDAEFVAVHPADLPEKSIGLQGVDTIVWFDADPADLKTGGDEKFRALQAWVRAGGKLVICQPSDWQKTLGFDDLLPVSDISIQEKGDLQPLRQLAAPRDPRQVDAVGGARVDPFAKAQPPFRFARATARPGTVTDEWIQWDAAPGNISPYLVRMPLGLGSVTWVAQNLADPTLAKSKAGWVNVWERIFDWQNLPLVNDARLSKDQQDQLKKPWDGGYAVDIGPSLLAGMELPSQSVWLVSVAVLFFIGYWLIAGPGSYTLLATRRNTQASWFVYAACAIVATGVTVLIVKVVLRGPPKMRHFSIVRLAPDQPANVTSRFGLYIPRDGLQTISVPDAAIDTVRALEPLPLNPVFLKNAPDEAGPEYTVPVVDEAAGENATLAVPYRSTLKKFQAEWSGTLENNGSVQGSVKLLPDSPFIDGAVTNGSGATLRNVYFAFKYNNGYGLNDVWLLYLSGWADGATLDLKKLFSKLDDGNPVPLVSRDNPVGPGKRVKGLLKLQWADYWLQARDLHAGPMTESFDDSNSGTPKSLVMMSLFDRLPPVQNSPNLRDADRIDVLRRGGRMLDRSASLSAGALVVLAEGDGPIPAPLTVNGQRVPGSGVDFYQFVLPIDHSAMPSATQPANPE